MSIPPRFQKSEVRLIKGLLAPVALSTRLPLVDISRSGQGVLKHDSFTCPLNEGHVVLLTIGDNVGSKGLQRDTVRVPVDSLTWPILYAAIYLPWFV